MNCPKNCPLSYVCMTFGAGAMVIFVFRLISRIEIFEYIFSPASFDVCKIW